MHRVFDNGQYWFRVELGDAQKVTLYRATPPASPEEPASVKWEKINPEIDFDASHQAVINQLNDFFGVDFSSKRKSVGKKMYVDEEYYFRINTKGSRKFYLQRAKKTEDALHWEKECLKDGSGLIALEGQVLSVLASSFDWELVYDGGVFLFPIEKHLQERLEHFFEVKL